LKNSPVCIFNAIPSETGTVEFLENLDHYTQLIVCAIDETSVA
jgi:hypothetical protein